MIYVSTFFVSTWPKMSMKHDFRFKLWTQVIFLKLLFTSYSIASFVPSLRHGAMRIILLRETFAVTVKPLLQLTIATQWGQFPPCTTALYYISLRNSQQPGGGSVATNLLVQWPSSSEAVSLFTPFYTSLNKVPMACRGVFETVWICFFRARLTICFAECNVLILFGKMWLACTD